MLAAVDSTGPDAVATSPAAGLVRNVLGQGDVRPGHLVGQALVDHGAGPFGGFLTGLD